LTGVLEEANLPQMICTQVRFSAPEYAALRRAADRSGLSIGELIREAVRRHWLSPDADGPVALCDGETRPSTEHDSIFDLK
jgi:hypothetical protein